jgi:hypothetical protein
VPLLALGKGLERFIMRAFFRYLVSFIALVLGSGTISPLISANWQEWAKVRGQDQYFVHYAGPLVDRLAAIAQSGWFIFATGFFVGGACCLWIDRLLRRQPVALTVRKLTAAEIPYGLHMISGSGVHVAVDPRKKNIQVGFKLRNSTEVPLRFWVTDMNVVIEGKTVQNPNFTNRGSVVMKGDFITFNFPPISHVIGKKDANATARIVYQYGLVGPDEKPLREAIYGVEITIAPKGNAYVTTEENDAPI